MRYRYALDLSQRYVGKPCFRGDLLAHPAKAGALSPRHSLLPRAGDDGQSVHWDRLFFVFRRGQFWRLGGGDSRLAAPLDVADWAGCARCDFLLRLDASGRSATEGVSCQRGRDATAARTMLDSLLYGRRSRRSWGAAQSGRIVLCYRLGSALDLGRKCRPVEPAEHVAAMERQRTRTGRTDRAQQGMDRRRGYRQPGVYFCAGPRAHVVALSNRHVPVFRSSSSLS